ncbi:MAG: hypothetical protein K9K67_03450 [Bacteriovoracaceae bacterium]|nr:hypothetical protein [Bacteriovoracaceae bacterium]
MLNGLKLINFTPSEELEAALKARANGQVFILRTCQRTLVLGFNAQPENVTKKVSDIDSYDDFKETFKGVTAYEFLLETICGLKSRILGENEIVHQFKEAYSQFLKHENPNSLIQSVLEKLFKDAKDIRSSHLKHIGLQTYAGITRKVLLDKAPKGSKVFILGSGELAEDLIKISHRRYEIYLCARNQERVLELKDKYTVKTLPWSERETVLEEKFIINTIGTKKEIFEIESLKKLGQSPSLLSFIDLSDPSPFTSVMPILPKAKAINLEGVFKMGEKISSEKEAKVGSALNAIKEKSRYRQYHFTLNFPFGWEELQFA